MSVPPDRMAARNPGTIKDPNKIMGLPKWAFFVIIAIGVVLAWYIYKRSQSSNAASLQTANAGTEPDTTNGVTAADIGGTPADNSFATQTDATALEEQIQAMQNSLFQLQQSVGGNGAGLPTTGPGGSTGGDPSGAVTPGGTMTGTPVVNPIPTPFSGPPDTSTNTPIGTPGGRPIDVPGLPGSGPVMTPQSNAAFQGNLNLVAQGLTPNPSGGHAVFY